VFFADFGDYKTINITAIVDITSNGVGCMVVASEASLEEVAAKIYDSGAGEIRDVDGGQEPFVYSTGNRGPSYWMIKGLVGQPETMIFLIDQLAHKVVKNAKFDFIEGNATGGMIPGWQLRNSVSELLGHQVPYTYLREARKEGGHGELITGIQNNPLIKPGMSALIVEELVNYAGTTTNAARIYREEGFPVTHGACIFSYDHADSNEKLKKENVTLVSVITAPLYLDIGEAINKITKRAADSCRQFLADTIGWQLKRRLVIPKSSAEKAREKGYAMRELSAEEAVNFGAPASKVKQGIIYCAEVK